MTKELQIFLAKKQQNSTYVYVYINTLTSCCDNIYVARPSKNENVRKKGGEDMRTKGGGLAH